MPQTTTHRPLLERRSALFVGLLAAILLTAGCKKTDAPAKPKAVSGDADKAKKTDKTAKNTPDEAGDKAGAGTNPDCDAYAKALCEMAGPTTSTCTQIKTVLDLLPPKACKAGMTDTEYTKARLAEMNKSCDELVKKLCGDLGEETKTCKMVREKTAAFGPEKCKQMLGDYTKVLGQLKQMEEANKPLSPEKLAMLTKPGAASWGPKDAKVTLIEFSDFQCPYCVRAAKVTTELKKKYKGKIRIIFHQFPLSFHKHAHLAAQAGLAALEQGKFWEMHDEMFANQKALERADLEKYAKKVGLDMKKFKAALDSGKFKAQVDADIKLGGVVAVRGTPTMFVNGARVGNPTDVGAVSAEIDAALAK